MIITIKIPALLIKRMVTIIGILTILGLQSVSGKVDKITFPAGPLTAAEALKEIERQTEYVIAYDKFIFDPSYSIVYSATEFSVDEALDQLLLGRDYNYVIKGTFILISRKTKPEKKHSSSQPAVYIARTGDLYQKGNITAISTAPKPKPPKKIEMTETVVEFSDTAVPPEPYSDYKPISVFKELQKQHPKLAIKTNLLYGAATLTPNLGIELGLGYKSSLDLSASYNPWHRKGTPDNNKKISHVVLRAEYRRWFCERFNGHFIGGHAYYTNFNIGGHKVPLLDFKKDKRYEGYGFGVGLAYGYHLPLAKRWGLEFNIGVGAAWLKYDRYECAICSEAEENFTKFYFGPTRAGITLVFIIR